MNKKKYFHIFGWYGTVAIVSAYCMNSFGWIDGQSPSYQLLNISGALGIIAISYYRRAYQPMVLNTIWLIIGLLAFSKLLF